MEVYEYEIQVLELEERGPRCLAMVRSRPTPYHDMRGCHCYFSKIYFFEDDMESIKVEPAAMCPWRLHPRNRGHWNKVYGVNVDLVVTRIDVKEHRGYLYDLYTKHVKGKEDENVIKRILAYNKRQELSDWVVVKTETLTSVEGELSID